MCKRVGSLSESDLESECPVDNIEQRQNQRREIFLMDTGSSTPGSIPSSNEDNPRIKFLCSFSGSILPRPQDGKLRYVGGETRIVSVSRDISYEELMVKMREIFEGAEVMKYQQPDEDLDALVSVVNDDDVTNMMEEYDKLGEGGGFTRLRIFLFSQSDQDCSFADGDERDHERWYFDALNSFNESPEFRRQQGSDLHGVISMEDVQLAEQYFNRMNLDGGMHNPRNFEVPLAHANLRQLRIPPLGSVQAQQNIDPRHNDFDVPWSPNYYSPRQAETHDPRLLKEFPTSPSSGRFHAPHPEFYDPRFGRMPEEYNAHQVNHVYEPPIQYTDNLVLLPTGPVPNERGGFPGNILHGSNIYEGNTTSENCRVNKYNQAFHGSPWNPEEQQHRDPTAGNGYHRVSNISAERLPYRDTPVMNTESNVNYSYVSREQPNPRTIYNDAQGHDGGWLLQQQSQPRAEELRYVRGAGRVMDPDMPHTPSHYLHPDDPRLVQGVPELGNQMFHDQAVATGTSIHIPPIDERMVRQNPSYVYGADNPYQGNHGHVPTQPSWRNIHSPVQGGLYDVSGSPRMANGPINPSLIRPTAESPRLRHGMESPQKSTGIDVRASPEYSHGQPFTVPSSYPLQIDPHTPELRLPGSGSLLNNLVDHVPTSAEPDSSNENNKTDKLGDEIGQRKDKELNQEAKLDGTLPQSSRASAQEHGTGANLEKNHLCTPNGKTAAPDDRLSFLPEFISSVKEATLENVKEVRAKFQEGIGSDIEHLSAAKSVQNEPDGKELNEDLENDSDNDNIIEPTEAEEEAIKRGLQTIRNEDLEEIRQLGSGTFGSVFHGKWKGSDVAIKRIKASCFAGKPTERERLIADFWKEALMLSSLHHPNVVSFYGVVRDGPDGSLATVTEFMVNGSLKQFLRKKDRTIDRRKRLIIAMDSAFGMEYLHEKNIVHFDLKCENLLVNMRDPHRPVCKIGDLGLSKVKQHTLVSGGVRGTLPWMAPELLSGKTNMVTEKIDVYSFGIVMWELLTGDEPYSDMHCASVIGGIVNDSLRPEIPTWCDPEWKSLMESCWASDPGSRPSFCEISQKLRTMAAAMNLK